MLQLLVMGLRLMVMLQLLVRGRLRLRIMLQLLVRKRRL
jgi:hypothetical protein